MADSRQLPSAQVDNPWSACDNDDDRASTSPPSTYRPRGDTLSDLRDDAVVRRDRDMIISPLPPPPSQAPPARMDDPTATNPHVASLKAIFPDFDDAVILSVLESTNYDHDRALDVLLGMNDPSFVPPNPPPTQTPDQLPSAPSVDAQRLSQEALDEQFARRLALEEQQAAAQTWQPQGMDATMYQPYQSRRGGRNGQPQMQGQGGRDTMTEFQEGFSRIAESGKKTFSSIVSKVKAKMQEFDQGQGWSGSQNPRPEQSTQPPRMSSYAQAPQQGPGQGAYAQPYTPARPDTTERQMSRSRTSPFSSSPPRSGVLRSAGTEPVLSASSQPSSYYDPNARGYDLYDEEEEEIQTNVRTTSATTDKTATATTTTQSAVTPEKPATPPPSSPPLPGYASPNSNSGLFSTTPPARSLSPTIAGAKATTPGTPGNVDFSKLGLLPKRPISLVGPQSPPTAGSGAPRVAATPSHSATDSSTDTEEPEFIENPFEDQK